MWTTQIHDGEHPGTTRFTMSRGSESLSYADVIRVLQEDEAFRFSFNGALSDASFSAFRWETRPVTLATSSRPFEFVLIDSPRLARKQDPEAFREHFERQPDRDVLIFPNLGGDAVMVVPRPLVTAPVYGHLAAFVRGAPEHQRDALWHAVGDAMAERVNAEDVWLSTAGAGVPWLHVRLDDRPKYYDYEPYLQGHATLK